MHLAQVLGTALHLALGLSMTLGTVVASSNNKAAGAVSLSVSKLSLKVAPSGEKPVSFDLKYPETIFDEISVASTDVFSVSFKLHEAASVTKPFAAQQVMLAIDSLGSKTSASFLLSSSTAGQYSLILDMSAEAVYQKLPKPSGKYTLTLYIADERSVPLKYVLGNIDLDVTPHVVKVWNDAGDVFSSQPEITHKMRQPEKMPKQTLSYVFTVATLSPWLLLISMWIALGANVSNLFASTSLFVFGTAFLAALASLLGLFYVYWCSLTLFELILYGLVISIPTMLLGHRTLVCRVDLREKSLSKGK
ncbi:hypothetical protein BASA61_006701 [Batrachochytrium salamandrivorans]|nr:hypothetical protein BASA60_002699 [Batrachochytrium salamandrivorans]KAH6585864.1 hypothetical protein BASA61_006701 [Batrachochytrium salamandrivorans]KAH9271668.1 hypothetical protein BASA83_006036 [Batrachochytrium salamandrivorans]KAJ1332712.1 hypothetical protein BSLG_008341 [Batrachochytrium salamandrivorans]